MMQLLLLLSCTLILVLSCDSFWSLWVSLELYSFMLMPWVLDGESKSSKVYVFVYFLTQFLASVALLMGSLSFFNKLALFTMSISFLMKMSCFPFHSWFVDVLPHLSWQKIMILISLSKLLPLALLLMLNPMTELVWILILGLVCPLSGLSTSCLRKIMAYSSVAHSSWMAICVCISKTLSLLYIILYLMSSIPLCYVFMKESLTSVKHILMLKMDLVYLLTMVFAFSGIPPFLGFIPKLLVMQSLSFSGSVVEAAALGILSILPMYMYFKMGVLSLSLKTQLEFSFTSRSGHLMILVSSLSILAMLWLLLGSSLLCYKTLTCQVKEEYPNLVMVAFWAQSSSKLGLFTIKSKSKMNLLESLWAPWLSSMAYLLD